MIVDVDCLHIGHVEVVDEWLMVVIDLDVVQVVEDEFDEVVEVL